MWLHGPIRSAAAVETGHAEFREGMVEALPFHDASFDKVFTVHTIYFWTSLEGGFREIYRVLSRGGRAFVGFLLREHMDLMNMPTDIFTTRSPEDVMAALAQCRFRNVRLERAPKAKWCLVIGER